MALLERVGTLIRANLNDLVDKAEDPEKMIKQLILDMQNQLLQVKTQVAVTIADQHLLMKKRQEHEQSAEEWVRKAELAVTKGQDDLARAALERSMTARQTAESFAEQVADQTAQVENLKTALRKLELKLAEARSKSDVLIAQHRRARALTRASQARLAMGDGSTTVALDRARNKVDHAEAFGQAEAQLLTDDVDERLAALEKQDAVEKLLAELKARKGGVNPAAG
jgi:phage shock protein A